MSTRMKVLSGFAAACMLTAPLAFGAPGTIKGSAHDFKGTTWGGGEVCKACHAPHNNQNIATELLWNHAVPAGTYTVYSSPSFGATAGQPAGTTKLCMSCHDGAVALDSYGGVTNGANFAPASAQFGKDLSNDHPVSFAYPANPTADELKATTTAITFASGDTGTIASLLDDGNVECQSCHDVHNTKSAGTANLLLIANSGTGSESKLCLTCHTK